MTELVKTSSLSLLLKYGTVLLKKGKCKQELEKAVYVFNQCITIAPNGIIINYSLYFTLDY
jgi:hypothetical protein